MKPDQTAKHFKMYKSGKDWIVAGLAIAVFGALMTSKPAIAQAASDSSTSVQVKVVANDNNSTIQDGGTVSAQANNRVGLHDLGNEKVVQATTDSGNKLDTKTKASTVDSNTVESSSKTENPDVTAPTSDAAVKPNTTAEDTSSEQATSSKDSQDGQKTPSGNENPTETPQIGWSMDGQTYTQPDGSPAQGVTEIDGVFYNFDSNGSLIHERTYTSSNDGNWYLFDQTGRSQTGVQKWEDTYYYFDPESYQEVTNNYVRAQWGDWYMFGKDGRIATGVYQWGDTYYYFDPSSYLKVTNDYRRAQWGDWYMFDKGGAIATGVYKWGNTYYYFDSSSYLKVTNDYRRAQWGDWYMFDKGGAIATGVYKWGNTYYYFDSSSYLKVTNDYRRAQWGDWYMFDKGGAIATGVYKWGNTYYYFDPSSYLKVTNDYRRAQWGDWYMFGGDGRIVTGLYNWHGTNYYFDPSTYKKATNRTVNVNGTVYQIDGNGVASSTQGVRDQIVRNLYAQLGKPYVWGANGPSAFDCSGLAQYVYGQIGISLPRVTYQQETVSHYVSFNDLQAGDLLFWGAAGASYHEAVYIGNGQYIDASMPGVPVRVSAMSSWTPNFAKRVL